MLIIRPSGSVIVDGREIGVVAQKATPGGRATHWVALKVSDSQVDGPDRESLDVVGKASSRRAAAQLLVDLNVTPRG